MSERGAEGARSAQCAADGVMKFMVGGTQQSVQYDYAAERGVQEGAGTARKRGATKSAKGGDATRRSVAGVQGGGDCDIVGAKHKKAYLTLAGIVNDSITDGEGLRLVFFAQGCPRRCEGCHNPTTLPFSGGTRYSVTELAAMAAKNPLLSGVTFSGGEPFAQSDGFTLLARELKKLRLNICIYTGYTFEQLIDDTAQKALLIEADYLVDGEFILAKRDISLRFKGSSNQRILDVVQSIKCGRAIETDSAGWR